MTAIAAATTVRFHVGLHTSDLSMAVQFYRVLLGAEPVKHHEDYAKFEIDRPPMVLALYANPRVAGGAHSTTWDYACPIPHSWLKCSADWKSTASPRSARQASNAVTPGKRSSGLPI